MLMVKRSSYLPAFFIALNFAVFSCKNIEEPIQAEIITFTESVYASLSIQPDQLYNVHAAVNGIIKEVLVKEGDIIQRQSPLIEINKTNPETNLQNAKLAMDLAKRNYEGRANLLNELKDEIAIAKLRLKNDSANFAKQRNLWAKNIGTQNTYEAKELAFLTSRSSYELLVNRLTRTEQDLLTRWQEAQNNYRNAQSNAADYTIQSRINGLVYEVLKEPGEMVSPQEPIALIGSASEFIIEMDIDEVDITRIENGQRVAVSLEAYPDQVFDAFISRIYPSKNMMNQTFRVEASFITPPEKLFAGLSGEANIIIEVKENALVIPRAYLSNDNKVKTEEGMVQVEIGLKSLDKVEILSGIETTTNLYLPSK